VPLLLLRHGRVSVRGYAALRADSRIELLETGRWTPDAQSLAQRVAATVVATVGQPLRALAYAVTGGISSNIVMLVSARYRAERAVLKEAGALACYTLPIGRADVTALLALLAPGAHLTHTDTTLRLTLDPISRMARYRDRSVHLSQREFAVLHCLSAHGGRPVDADELLRVVWGDTPASTRPRQIVDVYVHQLRRKLGTLGLRNPIATVRRFGYALGGDSTR
jgi:DNA-binding response OmpR family regulator